MRYFKNQNHPFIFIFLALLTAFTGCQNGETNDSTEIQGKTIFEGTIALDNYANSGSTLTTSEIKSAFSSASAGDWLCITTEALADSSEYKLYIKTGSSSLTNGDQLSAYKNGSYNSTYDFFSLTKSNQIFFFQLTQSHIDKLAKSGLVLQGYKINVTKIQISSNPFGQTQSSSNEGGLTLKGGAAVQGFKMGTVINYDGIFNSSYKTLVTSDFNSITFANELKPYSLLNQTKSKASTVKSDDGYTMPAFDFSKADKMLKFAQDNEIGVRGHVLVWDSNIPKWYFCKDYDASNSFVTADEMKARVKYTIETVIKHCEDNYPGVIYCWDVVNEAIDNSVGEDNYKIRKSRSGVSNYYYDVIGYEYVKLSFKYAHDFVTENNYSIKLFYNDFSTFDKTKCPLICNLVKYINTKDDINTDGSKLCDGVGMQSYIGGWANDDETRQKGCFKDSDLTNYKTAIEKYAALGVEVHITEMAIRNFYNTEEATNNHNAFYGKVIDLIKEEKANITSFSIWGICDNSTLTKSDYSYTMNGPYCGLFATQDATYGTYAKKTVYYTVLNKLNNK